MHVVPIKSLYNHLLSRTGMILARCGTEYTPPMPSFLSIEPSTICQLHCPQCPCGTKSTHREEGECFMSLVTFKRILSQCQGWVHTIQLYFQGEPLLNPHLTQMIQLAHEAHIYTTCSTNAQALTPMLARQIIQSGLDRIIVSIDGLSEDSYQSYRQGGSLNKAMAGLICLRQAKDQLGGSTHIELQCLRLKSNEHEWRLFERSYRKMGADSLTMKTAQFYDYEHGNVLMPSDERYSRYQQREDGIWQPKNRIKSMVNQPCRRILSGCVITVNGDVLPCCFDKSAQYKMGNIHSDTLHHIWQGETFQLFRRQVMENRMQFAICRNCTET